MSYGVQILHGLGHSMTELIKYVAKPICSRKVTCIKKVMSWNGYPRYVRNKVIKCLERTVIHLNNKILPQFFAKYPMLEYNEKH